MDDPYSPSKILKDHLNRDGKIIVTTPNWANPRGFMLMPMWFLFKAPITLADLNYLTPIDHKNWAKKSNMVLKWKTIERSWAHGDLLIKDFQRRIPNVLRDARLMNKKENVESLINWLSNNIIKLDHSLPHSGAIILCTYSKK